MKPFEFRKIAFPDQFIPRILGHETRKLQSVSFPFCGVKVDIFII